MTNVEVKTEINAPASVVYKHLMDFESFPSWNPMVVKISGSQTVGSKLEVHVKIGDRPPSVFKPTVVKSEEGKEFRWVGSLFFDFLYRGEHYFICEDKGDGKSDFVHGENFSGVAEGLINGVMVGRDSLRGAFALFNQAMKTKVEGN